MRTTTSAYRFTRHADEYAVTRHHDAAALGIVRRTGATWTACPATAEQGTYLYITEHWTRHNAAVALDAADREATRVTPAETGAPAVDQVRAQLWAAQRDGRLPESATFHVAAESDGTVNVDVRGMPDAWTYASAGYGHGQYTGAALQTIETVCRILDGIGSVDAHSVVIESEEEASERGAAEQATPDELAPGMYRVRVTVTNRDGVHTATEDMNPAAIELARTRPGWSVEILGESHVTIVADEQDTAEEEAPASRVHLIGIGNVPAVPLADVRPGDRIAWNYGQTYTVVRNTKVAANTYELVERGDDGREWTRRKRGTKLVARRPALTPPPTTAATSYATHCKSCDCTYAAVTSTDGPAIGYEYQPDGFTISTIRHICWPRDERAGRLVAARRAAAGDHRVRVIRPAYTIEQGARIILDGDTVTVLDVARDDTARTVTLTTSYGAPRTVTFNAAVPVLFGAEASVDDLARFENLGREAHRSGELRAPALNAEVMAAIGDGPVGEVRTLAIMRAFSRGYDAAISDELAALGF